MMYHHIKLDNQFNITGVSESVKKKFLTDFCEISGKFIFQFVQPQISEVKIQDNLKIYGFVSCSCILINEQKLINTKFICTILQSNKPEIYTWDCWLDEIIPTSFEKKYFQKKLEFQHFVYKVSHDIQGPVKSMKGLLLLLEEDQKNETTQAIYDNLCMLTNKLDELIYKLLEMVNVNSGMTDTVSVIDFEKTIYNTLHKLHAEKDISNIFFKIENETQASFQNLNYYLDLIFLHLIANAIESFEKEYGNEISITIKLDVNNNLEAEFINNGPVIPDYLCDKMFIMFNKGNKNGKHFGLGLYIVRNLVDMLEGDITCINRLEGVCFKLTLPNMAEKVISS